MIAQLYSGRDSIVRLFDSMDNCVADLPIDEFSEHAADDALRRMKLYRKTKWKRTEWGAQCRAYFKSQARQEGKQ